MVINDYRTNVWNMEFMAKPYPPTITHNFRSLPDGLGSFPSKIIKTGKITHPPIFISSLRFNQKTRREAIWGGKV